MPKTLNANYKRNVEILKINLGRGLEASQANNTINGMEAQFERANLYGPDEKQFINEMRAAVIEHFTSVKVTVNDASEV